MGKHKKRDKDAESDQEAEQTEVKESSDAMETSALDESVPGETEVSYEELVSRISVIANPLASRKLTKRLYKIVKKATKAKSIKRGVKDVVKSMRKGERGFVVLAGDVSPIDVITHIPVYCEDRSVPYAYVPSRKDLGLSSLTKRPTSVILVKKHKDYEEHFDKCFQELKSLPLPI